MFLLSLPPSFPKALMLSGILTITSGFDYSDDTYKKVFGKIDEEVKQNSRVYQTLNESTTMIGHRLTGSENGKKAEEHTFELFKKYGFKDVKYQAFEVESWMRDTVSLSIAPSNSDNFKEVPVVALAHSPVQAEVAGVIVDVGNGLEEDFEKKKDQIQGKVVLANIGLVNASGKKNLHRSEKTALAIRYGAKAIIMVNQAPGKTLMTGTASVTGSLISIPAVCISQDSGYHLRLWLEDEGPLEAQIEMTNFSKPIKSRNVIATLKGKTDDKIVIGGHLDSWDLATGAIDNGIGSYAIIDIARTFNALKIKPHKTIEFVMFMGEEQGLLGSKHYVQEAVASGDIKNISYMMNIDMTNNPKGINAYGRKEMEPFFREVGKNIKAVIPDYQNEFANQAGLHSDHQPFMIEGIPVTAMMGQLDKAALNCYHADCDNMKFINKQQLENTVRIGAMYLYALANQPNLNTSILTSEQAREFLISQGLKNELILGNSWKWEK
jgi:carboxypeptidase Q